MKNKVVLITGALTGIGRATALAFAREGTHIVVSGRHDDAGNALATELRTLGVEAEYLRADVRDVDWRTRQCRCPWPNRNADAESVHRNRRKKSWLGLNRAAQTSRETRRDRSDRRFSRLRSKL